MSGDAGPHDLFGVAPNARERKLKEPVPAQVVVLRESAKAVLVRHGGRGQAEHWIAKNLLIWNGLGEQRVQVERWKAAECEII